MSATKPPERMLRLPEVETLSGLKKSTIYAGVRAKTFPAPVRLSARAVAWPASAVDAWISQRVASAQRPEGSAC